MAREADEVRAAWYAAACAELAAVVAAGGGELALELQSYIRGEVARREERRELAVPRQSEPRLCSVARCPEFVPLGEQLCGAHRDGGWRDDLNPVLPHLRSA